MVVKDVYKRQRPVLFGTAGDTVRDELPDAVDACYFVHDEREPALAGAESIALTEGNRFAALGNLPESEHVLVVCLLYTSRRLSWRSVARTSSRDTRAWTTRWVSCAAGTRRVYIR